MSKGIVFLGTPHRGADIASWAGFAARALQVVQMGTATNNRLLADLQRNSGTLWQISQQFVERGSALTIRTFYETVRMDFMSSLVFFLQITDFWKIF
jgi:hypothetical protein